MQRKHTLHFSEEFCQSKYTVHLHGASTGRSLWAVRDHSASIGIAALLRFGVLTSFLLSSQPEQHPTQAAL